MTDEDTPRACRSLLEETPGDGRSCPNKPKFAVEEEDGTISFCCVVHKPDALAEGLAVDFAS